MEGIKLKGICNTYCSSTAKIVTRMWLDISPYVHCLYCWI